MASLQNFSMIINERPNPNKPKDNAFPSGGPMHCPFQFQLGVGILGTHEAFERTRKPDQDSGLLSNFNFIFQLFKGD